MNPDTLQILAIIGVALAAFAPKLWEKLKPFFPTPKPGPVPSPEKTTDDVDIVDAVDDGFQYLRFYSVHDLIEFLMEDRKKAKDKEGLLLIGSFGSHIYNKLLEGVK